MLFPILWVVLTSIKPADISQALPPVWSFTPTLDNYPRRARRRRPTRRKPSACSLFIASSSPSPRRCSASLVAVPAAYALARLKFRGKQATANWILSTIMFPPVVSVIPVFIIASRLGLTDTWPVLVIPYAAFGLPMMIWMLRSSSSKSPSRSRRRQWSTAPRRSNILRQVVLPLLMPGIVSASLLAGMMSWNEFLFALTLTRSAVKTAPVGISEFTNMYGTQWGSLTAAATVTVAPILLVTLILRRRVVEGLTFGAVK